MQGRQDHTIQPRSAQYIYDRVASKEKNIVWLEESGHVITIDIEREQVFTEVSKFLRNQKV